MSASRLFVKTYVNSSWPEATASRVYLSMAFRTLALPLSSRRPGDLCHSTTIVTATSSYATFQSVRRIEALRV